MERWPPAHSSRADRRGSAAVKSEASTADRLRAGDWVEVRSKDEILQTLDKNGRLDEMPFMPQMFQYCGMRFKVRKRAHKTCDPDLHRWPPASSRMPCTSI